MQHMKTRNKARKTWKKWMQRAASLFLLLLFIGILGIAAWIQTAFDSHIRNDFLQMTAKGEAPRFYVYHFSDRLNREGTAELLLDGTPTQMHKTAQVSFSELPQHVVDSFVCIEDKRFFEHHGVDWYRTVSATLHYLLGSKDRFGASTITQQLVKNVTGNSDVTLHRKLQEIFYALDLERTLDKTEILEQYVNIIPFSDRCNGIAEASEHYFGKAPMELTIAEGASLAAITNSPSYYNPIRHPDHNIKRRNLILSEMQKQGKLTDTEYQEALSEPLTLHVSSDSSTRESEIYSWYVDMAIEDVIVDLMKKYEISRTTASNLFYSGGLQIDLAMDPNVQKYVEDYYRTSVRAPIGTDGSTAQSALIVLDRHTGDILGVAGGVGEKKGNRLQNFATQTQRAPGSVIKPLSVYAPALAEGIIRWGSVFDDVPLRSENGVAWPKNATGIYRGLTTVSYAVAHSTNTVSVRVLEKLGIDKSFDYAKNKFHLESLLSTGSVTDRAAAALALGQTNYGVTLRELTAAYTVFADGGVYHPWRSYYRVTDAEGNLLLASPDRSEVVLSEGNAAIMTKLLQGVVEHGTASTITLKEQIECAGKTGTTSRDGDRWFIGYTPELICGVWCGFEYPQPVSDKRVCTRIWDHVMQELSSTATTKDFEVPSSVIQAAFCKDSGNLYGDACACDPRSSRMELGWFIKGTEPHQVCDRHVLCEYDVTNGGVNHGFCPEEDVELRALLKLNRNLPQEVYVQDAQYAYGGDPLQIAPNTVENESYFGVSNKNEGSDHDIPFHRSCPIHTDAPHEKNWWNWFGEEFPNKKE